MLWISDQHKHSYTGSWKDGQMEGNGEMTYLNGSVYTGWWYGNIRYGHGRMEYKEPESLYIGGWKDDMREGYGVFHNTARYVLDSTHPPLVPRLIRQSRNNYLEVFACMHVASTSFTFCFVRGEHYLGMWKSDKFHGPGILIDKSFYSGLFCEGKRVESSSVAVLEHDDKWTALFHWCAELLEEMVKSREHYGPFLLSTIVSHLSYGLLSLASLRWFVLLMLFIIQVTISHSNPDISHRASDEQQHGLDGDMYGEAIVRSIWVGPNVLGESCQDCHSKTRNADNECVVCSIEVLLYTPAYCNRLVGHHCSGVSPSIIVASMEIGGDLPVGHCVQTGI